MLSFEFWGSDAAEPPDVRSVKSDAVGWLCGVSLPQLSVQVRSHFWTHLPFLFLIHPSPHDLLSRFFWLAGCVHSVTGCFPPQCEQ